MSLGRNLAVLCVILPALLFSSDAAPPATRWHIRGSLTEACSCSVPCTCNFGESPSPHPFCYSMYSYKIDQGRLGEVKLDGLKFGSTDAKHGRIVYIDRTATPEQRTALLSIAESVLGLKTAEPFYSGQAMNHLGTRYVEIIQEADEKGHHLKLGDDGEFRARYIVGRDGKNPVVVRNNTTWDIGEAIKGKTEFYRYRLGRNQFSFKNTNSNQGEFEFDSSRFEPPAPEGPHCGK